MAGSVFGKIFQVSSFGESHGPAIGCIVDGCPSNLAIDINFIQSQLNRRRPGQSRYVTQRREADEVQILSGVFEGQSTGAPIAMLIHNKDQRSKDYDEIKDKFRPAHADITYFQKYGIRDYRGGGRSSARETAMRVAAGAIAQLYLRQFCNFKVQGYISQIGDIQVECKDLDFVSKNPFNCADCDKVTALEQYLQQLLKKGDSCGARIEVIAENVPKGLGEPVFDRLDADIAKAMMSINAVKAVSIGSGFDCVSQLGSEHRDEITSSGYLSNNCGGVLGGISTGQNLTMSIAVKPTSSIRIPARTINTKNQDTTITTKGRHDPCVGIRAVPIAEAMLSLVVLDHLLRAKSYQNNF